MKHKVVLVIGFGISIFALLFLFWNLDSETLLRSVRAVRWGYLPGYAAVIYGGIFLFAVRWWILLEHRVSYRRVLALLFLGQGMNMLLPARGGDILRVYKSKIFSGLPTGTVTGRMLFEKVIDLFLVFLAGAGAIFYQLNDPELQSRITVVLFILLLSLMVSIPVLLYRREMIHRWSKEVFHILRLSDHLHEKITSIVRDITRTIRLSDFLSVLLISVIGWGGFYAFSYVVGGELLGLSLNYPEALILTFAGMLGVMLPSAPSGVGVYHASIVSAFLLLQKERSDGVIYATILHLTQVVLLALPGISVYYYLMKKSQFRSIL